MVGIIKGAVPGSVGVFIHSFKKYFSKVPTRLCAGGVVVMAVCTKNLNTQPWISQRF